MTAGHGEINKVAGHGEINERSGWINPKNIDIAAASHLSDFF
jgi:hypothetical protein